MRMLAPPSQAIVLTEGDGAPKATAVAVLENGRLGVIPSVPHVSASPSGTLLFFERAGFGPLFALPLTTTQISSLLLLPLLAHPGRQRSRPKQSLSQSQGKSRILFLSHQVLQGSWPISQSLVSGSVFVCFCSCQQRGQPDVVPPNPRHGC